MPHREVKKSIATLKDELTKTPKETGTFEEKLELAKEEIEKYTPEAVQDFVHFLQDEATEFEVEHPQITALINQVTTALSNLGI